MVDEAGGEITQTSQKQPGRGDVGGMHVSCLNFFAKSDLCMQHVCAVIKTLFL